MSINPTDAMYFFMITAFTKKMEEAAAKGDKKTFDAGTNKMAAVIATQ